MEFKDYYATLGVAKDASDKEIKQAYRKLARKLHPDVNPGDTQAESRFKAINEAHEVLGDSEKRRKYDELGANWRLYEQAQQQGGPSPFDGFWQRQAGGAPGGASTMSEDDIRQMFGGDDPFSDFFHVFFGGAGAPGPQGGRARATRSRRGRDVEQELELSLDEALTGTTRRLSIKHEGHARAVEVRIPAGVSEGSRVRVAGEGAPGSAGAGSGDLYLRVRLAPHGRFERKGRDLHTRVGVPVTRAVLGGEAEIHTLDGRALRLKIPAETQNGQVFRLKGHGMPAVGKADVRGDLYVTIEVRVPRGLTPEARRLYETLSRLEDGSSTSTDES